MPRAALHTRLQEGIAAALVADRARARTLLREVVEQDPRNDEAWLWLAAVAPSPEEAAPYLRRVIEISPDHPHARSALGRVMLGCGLARTTSDPPAARSLFASAAELLPAGDEMRHLVLNRLVARGVTLVQQGERHQAREIFHQAATLAPENARVWFALAQLATSTADAVDPLRRAVLHDPNHQKARVALAAVLADMANEADASGDRSRARTLLAEACAVDSSNVDTWIARGRAEEGADVIACVERIRQLSPEHPAVVDLVLPRQSR